MCKKLTFLAFVLALALVPASAANAGSLVGWWKFDGDTQDSSGLDNHGTAGGNPTYVTGIVGSQALDFDGDDYVAMDGVVDDIPSDDITMAAWINTTASGEGDWFSMNPAGGNQFLLCILDGDIRFWEGGWQPAAGVTVNDGTWHHIVATRENMNVRIYVNGAYQSAGSYTSAVSFGPGDRWSIGQEWDGETPSDFYTGSVDDVQLYNRALSAEQVQNLFNGIQPEFPQAGFPSPADGAENVTKTLLEWVGGDAAVSHDIYFGTNKTEVAAGTGTTFQGNQTATSFSPDTLSVGTTYYWRIDEQASDGATIAGEIWSFTTAEFIIVDDFEDYNDYPPDEIYTTWEDGLTDPANGGSQVGYLTVPAVETQIVHGGAQSMPFFYDNSAVSYSEAVRTFETPQDFTGGGLSAMTLWYQGQPAATGGVTVDAATQIHTISGSGADIGGSSDEFHYAFKQLTGEATITVKVESITDTHSWAKAGIMIRETLDADSLYAMAVVTPSGRVAFGFRSTLGFDSHSTHTATDTISLPHWIRLNRSSTNLFKAEHSADGINWAPVESSDPGDPSGWNVLMNPDVYIGLVVSARDNDAVCEATISNIAVTGNVPPGPFTESQDVGIGSNSPEPLYLRLEDAAGTPGTVYHEDGPDAVLATDWQLWAIPLEDFQAEGVDVTAVTKIALGVGDKNDPQLGGTGMLIVDDIQLVRRIPTTAGRELLFEEDFESLVLGPSVDEDDAPADNEAWTDTPPAGWVVDDSGVPGAGDPANDGATEWAGWSFAKKDWWAQIGQQRDLFDLANGIVAIADGDEWDDADRLPGLMNALLSTAKINVTAIEPGADTLQLKFDSSWRRYANQTAVISAQFDDKDSIEILRWESEGGDPIYLKNDAVSETVAVNFAKPAGAKQMVITFAYLDAGNDWWWAFDNVQVTGIPRERTIIFAEDFEGLELGPSVEESPGTEEAWTDTPPAGWIVDESAVPGAGDPDNDGVTEWAGWSFANKEFWINTDFQRRDEFELGQGTIAVADSDEYDDASHPAGSYDTYLTTPAIAISGFEAGTLQLKFDSSWRPEVIQTANVTVQYDGGEPEEVLRFESQQGANFKDDNSTNDTIIVDLDNPPGASSAILTFGYFNTDNNWWWAIDNIEISALPREKAIVFAEDFEGLPLGPNVDETVAGDEVWTRTAPEGWTLDDSGVPGLDEPENGVTEWAGWSFADNDWWASVDDQRRSEFELAIGAVAVADSDEYDDKGNPVGTFNAFMSTPPIDISDLEAGSAELIFDSSWRPESSQTANITASFDGGDPVEVMLWVSNSGSQFYHDHNTNETVTVPLDNPEGAQSLVLTFGYFDASNNWWWAIDNVLVTGFPKGAAPPIRVFSEKFDGVTLLPSVDEAPPGDFWSKTPPDGWAIDDSQMAGFGDPATDGVTDWAGWSFADKDWWVQVAGDQERSTFELGTGVVAIADPDEWDDLPHTDGTFNSFLDTTAIDISGVDAGTIDLKFDSSWRPEAQQTAEIAVSFDGGAWVQVMLWESGSGSPNYHDHTTSETVTVSIDNPAGAQSMVVSFGLFNAGNNWWWAIDNIEVTGTSAGGTVQLLVEDFENVPLGPSPEEAPPGVFWTDVPPEGWIVDDSGVPGAGDPANDGVTEWAGWSFVSKSWWVQMAGDDERSLFDNSSAVVAVAEPDEWDDLPHTDGTFNSFLDTTAID
ncbi:MAG: LamG domain-containing protein, partial [Planctomycetota bacterium]